MKILALTPVSVTVELENCKTPYYCESLFNVSLNGKILRSENKNIFSVFGLQSGKKYTLSARQEEVIFELPPEYVRVSVLSFGAKGDGKHDDTLAFYAAFACLGENSVLYVPKGDYLVKPIFLKSGITVYLEKGATILGAVDRESYPVLPAIIKGKNWEINVGTWQGEEADCFASVFTAYNQKNISIIGEGTIDCRASLGDWYINHRVKRGAWRPRGVFFNRCENVLLQGITVKNTPSWNIHPYFCKNVKLLDLTLENPPSMPTTDGIDPDSCENVEIAGVNISVGDDCIALKSQTFEAAKKYKQPCRNIDIRNCLMRCGHGGVVFGSELSGGIENVNVSQCLFEGTDRGFRIKTRRGRGHIGKCDGVNFSDIKMVNVKVPFVINMYYNMGDENGHTEYVWTTEKLPFDERTPVIGSFTFKNTECVGVEYAAGAFYGLPESPIKSIKFKNVRFEYNKNSAAGYPDMKEQNTAVKNQGLDFHFAEEVILENVSICGQTGQEVLLDKVNSFNKF